MIVYAQKEGRTINKGKRRKRGKCIHSGIATPSSSPPPPHPFYPTVSNAICTANGGHFAHARRWTKALLDPWCTGALRGAILGDVATTPKMAGLAYEDWTGSVRLCTLQEADLARGDCGENSEKCYHQTVETHHSMNC